MLTAAVSAFIFYFVFKKLEKDDDSVDAWTAFSYVIVPALIVFLLSLVILWFKFPDLIALLLLLFYFVAPFLMMKYQTGFSQNKSAKYAGILFAIALVVEISFSILLGSG